MDQLMPMCIGFTILFVIVPGLWWLLDWSEDRLDAFKDSINTTVPHDD